MRVDDLILLTLLYSESQMIAGRTLFQKTLYFLNEKMSLGIEFVAHYYGPYSPAVADEIAGLTASGLATEKMESFPSFSFGATFEPRKYTYHLTGLGQEVAAIAEKRNAAEAEQIKTILKEMKQAGANDDYKSLSVAAKMRHILKTKGPMKASQILSEAKALDWHIQEAEAEAAVKFLESLALVKRNNASKSDS